MMSAADDMLTITISGPDSTVKHRLVAALGDLIESRLGAAVLDVPVGTHINLITDAAANLAQDSATGQST